MRPKRLLKLVDWTPKDAEGTDSPGVGSRSGKKQWRAQGRVKFKLLKTVVVHVSFHRKNLSGWVSSTRPVEDNRRSARKLYTMNMKCSNGRLPYVTLHKDLVSIFQSRAFHLACVLTVPKYCSKSTISTPLCQISHHSSKEKTILLNGSCITLKIRVSASCSSLTPLPDPNRSS